LVRRAAVRVSARRLRGGARDRGAAELLDVGAPRPEGVPRDRRVRAPTRERARRSRGGGTRRDGGSADVGPARTRRVRRAGGRGDRRRGAVLRGWALGGGVGAHARARVLRG